MPHKKTPGTITYYGGKGTFDPAFADHASYFESTAHFEQSAPSRPKCVHYGEDPVFTVGGRRIYGARGSDANANLYSVVLDCAGLVRRPFLSTTSARFAHLKPTQHFLRLEWPDRAAPPVAPQWWLRLARAIPKRADVLVACVGSHGRTGTALALLALAYGVVETAEDAIRFVRKEHCARAIESKAQETYIRQFAEYLAKGERK